MVKIVLPSELRENQAIAIHDKGQKASIGFHRDMSVLWVIALPYGNSPKKWNGMFISHDEKMADELYMNYYDRIANRNDGVTPMANPDTQIWFYPAAIRESKWQIM